MSRTSIKSVRAAASSGAGSIRRKLIEANHSALQAAPLPLYASIENSPTPSPAPSAPFGVLTEAEPEQSTAQWLAGLQAEQRLETGPAPGNGRYIAPTPASTYVQQGPDPAHFSENG